MHSCEKLVVGSEPPRRESRAGRIVHAQHLLREHREVLALGYGSVDKIESSRGAAERGGRRRLIRDELETARILGEHSLHGALPHKRGEKRAARSGTGPLVQE